MTHVVTHHPNRIDFKPDGEEDQYRRNRRVLIGLGAYEVHDKANLSLPDLSAQIIFSPAWRRLAQVIDDDLVGLKNYKGFTASVVPQLQMMEDHRNLHVASLVVIDANKFKSINDVLGHLKGDLALQSIARALQGQVRRSDLVARKSGDEFLVWLPGLPLTEAKAKAADLVRAVAEIPFEGKDGAPWPLSITAGVAQVTEDEIGKDTSLALLDLFKRADEDMLEGKPEGSRKQR